jgi:hypothetical protein
MISLKRFLCIYVLSIALALSACITPSNNLDYSDDAPRKKNGPISQPAPDKLAASNKKTSSPNKPDKKEAPIKPISLAEIHGQNKRTLIKVLGRPSFKRSDRPAEIWRYHDKACLLDIYLYQPLRTNTPNALLVNYIEARMPQGTRMETLRCLNIIRHRFVKSKLS